MATPKTIALFYDGFEAQANDMVFGRVRSDLRGLLRRSYRRVRGVQPYTGFYTAFLNLKRSLEHVGVTVRVNDFAYARANPSRPIGLCGFKTVYDKVRLGNPAMFGPGVVPLPTDVLPVIEQCNIQIVTQPCEWHCAIWRPVLGDRVQPMFVGIDTEAWPDLSAQDKSIDVIIYDKIRWYRDDRVPELLEPLKRHLEATKKSYVVLRYGGHHLTQFREALSKARSMVFLCEHETQGLAYQEAMSSGVPILAWDEGRLVGPKDREIAPPDLEVSSVPYFDDRCGLSFKADGMIAAFERFWQDLDGYQPRAYVCETLGLEAGARRYLDLFSTLER